MARSALTFSGERLARLTLNALPGIGPVTFRRLADAFGANPENFFRVSRERLLAVKGIGAAIADVIFDRQKLFNADREIEKLAARGMDFLIPGDAGYPPLLREIYDPPIGLYSLGGYAAVDRAVAVVGSRKLTPYGRDTAKTLAGELAAAGWCVVSGLARGIDTAAHRGALEAGGQTVAVLGCGADIIYPPENFELYRAIAERGCILSEFTLGRKADRQTFPMRNRVVAGMSRAVVVIESDVDGGSMITAKFAADQGRTVCAVPGRADQAASRGCHALIRDGAILVTTVDEILEELGESRGVLPAQSEMNFSGKTLPAPDAPAPEEQALLAHFAGGVAHGVDSLVELTRQPAPAIMSALIMMELKNLLIKGTDGRYEARRR